MSVQTGDPVSAGPASSRAVDRARFRVNLWRNAPNPIWIRELKQAARLGRTPIVLMVVTILMALMVTSVGGMASTSTAPGRVGAILYQVFFTCAFFVVVWVGPGVAANSIASEREGRTWEALVLTGLAPETIARGKFLAAFTAIGTYIVMLAPVGAVPFLFGGVTALEVIGAFALLFVFAVLGVAFGLAISSKMQSLRVAIVVALLLAVPVSMFVCGTFGVALSAAFHSHWKEVPEAMPVWLPSALVRVPLSGEYVLYLVLLPALAIALPSWFLYEVTVANLTAEAGDRSTRLKRWLVVTSLLLTVAGALPTWVVPDDAIRAVDIVAVSVLFMFFVFTSFVFAGEPIGPSRRIAVHWDRERVSRLRRFFGPSLVSTTYLELACAVSSVFVVTLVCALAIHLARATLTDADEHLAQMTFFSAYAACFLVFTIGLRAWLRASGRSPMVTRVLLAAVLFAVAFGPFIIAAVGGLFGRGSDDAWIIIAAPSPFYAFYVAFEAIHRARDTQVIAGAVSCVAWGGLGVVFTLAARRRAIATQVEVAQRIADADARLDADDAPSGPDSDRNA